MIPLAGHVSSQRNPVVEIRIIRKVYHKAPLTLPSPPWPLSPAGLAGGTLRKLNPSLRAPNQEGLLPGHPAREIDLPAGVLLAFNDFPRTQSLMPDTKRGQSILQNLHRP